MPYLSKPRPDDGDLITREEVGELLGIDAANIARMRRRGTIPEPVIAPRGRGRHFWSRRAVLERWRELGRLTAEEKQEQAELIGVQQHLEELEKASLARAGLPGQMRSAFAAGVLPLERYVETFGEKTGRRLHKRDRRQAAYARGAREVAQAGDPVAAPEDWR